MIGRFLLVATVLLLVVVVSCSSSADPEADGNGETVVTSSATAALGATSVGSTSATPTPKPPKSSVSTPESDATIDPDSLDPYLLTMLEMTRFIGEAMWPPIMLDGIDWRAAQQKMIDAGPEIRVARAEAVKISPPKTCSEFHFVWLEVMTELEVRIALGVEVTGKMINDDQAGALELSGAYDYQQELYGEMTATWRACHESIDPDWERKIGFQQ